MGRRFRPGSNHKLAREQALYLEAVEKSRESRVIGNASVRGGEESKKENLWEIVASSPFPPPLAASRLRGFAALSHVLSRLARAFSRGQLTRRLTQARETYDFLLAYVNAFGCVRCLIYDNTTRLLWRSFLKSSLPAQNEYPRTFLLSCLCMSPQTCLWWNALMNYSFL